MSDSLQKNITRQVGKISATDRQQLIRQTPRTLWLTGLSGAGKSTLAYALENILLTEFGHYCYVLDGDNLRHGLNNNLGFSAQDRLENIRRAAEVAKLMNDAGLIVIGAFVPPLIEMRSLAKQIIGQERFREIYVSTPLSECEKRDPKGLYQKARQGEIKDFTGISAPYEPPQSPDLWIDTTQGSLQEQLQKIVQLVIN